MASVKALNIFILFFLLIPIACSRGATSNQQKIQEPVISGSWYPADKEGLKREINLFLDSTEPEKIDGDIVALIEPHAGYSYSGKGAAFGYKAIKGKNYKRVIMLAPSHYAWFNGVAVLDATHYRTPLGLISIDTDVCKKLLQEPYFKTVPEAYKKEHSIEIQLPFIQQSLKDVSLVPLLVGEVNGDEYRKIASSIKKFIDKETLVIASSDFTHYGFNFGYIPFKKNIRKNLKKLDSGAVEKILKIDSEGFIKYVDKTGITICGRKPIAILLEILPKNINARLISYYTSGDLIGNYSTSVSYVTMAFFKKKEKNNFQASDEDSLNKEERETLVKLARKTLDSFLNGGNLDDVTKGLNLTPKLKEKRGVFVTIKKHGNLRGCIGYIEGIKPLYEAVIDNTINACSRDYRFVSMVKGEDKEVALEISVMTPLKEIKSVDEIVVGKHGLVIQKGFSKGLLLPQVATEYGWDRETFLNQVSLKAGLPYNAWKSGSTIWTFSAQVFGEE
ncbi:MAG: hypothetical protein A3C43_03235 [Candidatus Schekmanbacteria bacterium RIFCSPHIGHO2_02_FULL_38_11]|uniref:MEMO1 family protein A3G31_09610 n=1 Tax=Candidatus Schekmanbacteria bacterium RIFCSPLOWO2_12_FULL_38_15 TaxID=1817883 RepID=A0A1F7SPU7_9BACT|nr:MAG: hypothetical protein A2043_03000 [Candidatus Schekmanbacteria bacterium GWA2_38_9]OGL50107.1 MAG: hypothetical protein A3H37_07320 [Candidatus Schekmanbacteria bacterium RIFCSPLOWO2_02_FULL_38_14]OGL54293.1 MAG: hypothetical protein A3C43_03235 [Candidatus Schekmanbacteria bacterium RIFCSPHIGHO2_02_FULL_38_11]OGL55217.1 MAG: hypothetical protein A3G31_09610 [Candidatus Schekmanbacteria bacterium RIFCSPLOWO2_12_FULL_38_15]